MKAEAAEFAGTALLVAAVVGSGIMGERLAGGNAAIALLANSLATGGVLLALIQTFAPVSGAHFNPVVTLSAGWQQNRSLRSMTPRVAAQAAGGVTGVAAANIMFGLPIFSLSRHIRGSSQEVFAEAVATFGLITIARLSPSPSAVAAYIVGAYWFTSSTSFANPAVTLARSLSDSFSGIRPADVPLFIAAQAAGGGAAAVLVRWWNSGDRKTDVG